MRAAATPNGNPPTYVMEQRVVVTERALETWNERQILIDSQTD